SRKCAPAPRVDSAPAPTGRVASVGGPHEHSLHSPSSYGRPAAAASDRACIPSPGPYTRRLPGAAGTGGGYVDGVTVPPAGRSRGGGPAARAGRLLRRQPEP